MIEQIAGVHHEAEGYTRRNWDVQYFSSQEINRVLLQSFLHGRFGKSGYALSELGKTTYQVWAPNDLNEVS